MPLPIMSIDDLRSRALAAVRSRFAGRSTHSEAFIGKLPDALAGLLWTLHGLAQQSNYDSCPQAKSSYEALAGWATLLGLPDGAGGLGAKLASEALGLSGTATGTPGQVVWNGIGAAPTIVSPDGSTFFEMTAAATIGGGGSVGIQFSATTKGTAGNLTDGAMASFVATIPGVDSTITSIVGPTTLGTDAESPSSLLARVIGSLQDPPKAMTAHDHRTVAEGVTGIVRCFAYPLRSGTGTADFVVLQAAASSGGGRIPTDGMVLTVAAAIGAVRNVGAAYIGVMKPTSDANHDVVVRVVPISRFPFDWDSSVGTFTLDTVVDSTHYKLNTVAPADLKAAITAGATTGTYPRIQVRTTGVILPQVLTVINWSDGGGKTTLTLQTAADVLPVAGNQVHAGATFVTPVARAVLDVVDSLGPSLVSEYGDSVTDSWEDVVDPFQIARAATSVVDESTGLRYLSSLVGLPTIDGFAVAYQPQDAIVTAPGLTELRSVVVTP